MDFHVKLLQTTKCQLYIIARISVIKLYENHRLDFCELISHNISIVKMYIL